MYGIQTQKEIETIRERFENDVKMYGIQTCISFLAFIIRFENDVKMYGIQTETEITDIEK